MRITKMICWLLLIGAALALAPTSQAQIGVGVSITVGPPALPVYPQPICPSPGYIWTPGYWAYGPEGYFWVPGTWAMAPAVGLLWTPGYWGWGGGVYLWHAGYWGPHVGFYGGINYGYGYTGSGFYGGEWRGGVYHYNTAVTNVNRTIIHNTYNTTVINNHTTINNVSYNGGRGGITARPTGAELSAEHERHIPATSLQSQHEHAASTNRALLASENHGRPSIAATTKPGVLAGPGVVPAHSGGMNANRNATPTTTNHMGQTDRPPSSRTNANSTVTNSKPNASMPPSTAHTKTTQTNTMHSNTEHPNTTHSNTMQTNPNTSHPNTSHPPSPPQNHQSQPQPHEHPGGGHPGAKLGR